MKLRVVKSAPARVRKKRMPRPQVEITTPWHTVKQAAKYLGVSMHSLNTWRQHGKGPKFYAKHHGTGQRAIIRYHISDLDTFIKE